MKLDKDPRHLHPLALSKMMRHMELVGRFVPRGFLLETWVSMEEQLRRYMIGRDATGKVIGDTVTDAKPGDSWHNLTYHDGRPCSLAYHVGILDEGGRSIEGFGSNVLSEKDKEDYLMIGRLGEYVGTTWGGRWRRRDLVHHELRIAALSLVKAALRVGEELVDLRRLDG